MLFGGASSYNIRIESFTDSSIFPVSRDDDRILVFSVISDDLIDDARHLIALFVIS